MEILDVLEQCKKNCASKEVVKNFNGKEFKYTVYKLFVYWEEREYEERKYDDYSTLIEGVKLPIRLSVTKKCTTPLTRDTLSIWVRLDAIEGVETAAPNNFSITKKPTANGRIYENLRLWINRIEEQEKIAPVEELPF